MDEFEQTETLIYAVEDTQIKIMSFEEVSSDELKKLMQDWLAELIKLSWLSFLADKGNDILITWRDGTFLEGTDDLTESFRENQGILSMLLGVRFASEDKKFLT